ncbi:MAG: permease-like cell division protein FtsX [Clostridia bacterium]|nr:permease-like cell division protein FtsX [Clostridia bacterium]
MAKKRNRSGGLNTTYLTKMGARNIIANRSMSFSSVSVLTACLLLIGVSVMILVNIQNLVKDVENQNVVVAFVKEGISDEEVAKVGTDLSAIPDVTAVEFVSKEAGYEEQLREFGVDENLFDDVIDNPLPHSYRVSVSNLEQFQITLTSIKAVANVESVRESQELVSQISTLQNSITAICVIIVAVLAVVSMFIISNTIRITMVSRKIDIQVMKSVGATNTFICWPFMIEGVIIGVISGILAVILTFLVEKIEGGAMQSLLEMFGSESIALTSYLPLLIVAYLFSGVFIGAFGSIVSISKYLKKEGSEANEML